MIRQAYFEDAAYVPLVLRSYELWRKLEEPSRETLLRITGVLSVGRQDSEIICGTRRAAAEHGLAAKELSRQQIQERYPSLKLSKDEVALFESDGGVLGSRTRGPNAFENGRGAGAELRFQNNDAKLGSQR